MVGIDDNKVVLNLSNEELSIVEKALRYLAANIEEFNDMQNSWGFPTVSASDIQEISHKISQ